MRPRWTSTLRTSVIEPSACCRHYDGPRRVRDYLQLALLSSSVSFTASRFASPKSHASCRYSLALLLLEPAAGRGPGSGLVGRHPSRLDRAIRPYVAVLFFRRAAAEPTAPQLAPRSLSLMPAAHAFLQRARSPPLHHAASASSDDVAPWPASHRAGPMIWRWLASPPLRLRWGVASRILRAHRVLARPSRPRRAALTVFEISPVVGPVNTNARMAPSRPNAVLSR